MHKQKWEPNADRLTGTWTQKSTKIKALILCYATDCSKFKFLQNDLTNGIKTSHR